MTLNINARKSTKNLKNTQKVQRGMESECGVCCEEYTEDSHEPVTLPTCGHTFCRVCLTSLQQPQCPTCRSTLRDAQLLDLPTNYTILNLVKGQKTLKVNHCEIHQEKLIFWCKDCQSPLCGVCIFKGHVKEGHIVVEVQTKVQETRVEIQNISKDHIKLANEKKGLIFKNVHNEVLNVIKKLHDIHCINESIETVEVILIKSNSSHDMHSQNTQLAYIESLQSNLNKLMYEENTEISEELNGKYDNSAHPAPVTLHSKLGCIDEINKRFGRLEVDKNKIVLYALVEENINYYALIKSSLLLSLVKKDEPVAFLDVRVNDEYLGRIYIQLWGHLRRAQHFLALCLGTYGPSLTESNLNNKKKVGEPGETLGGDDFLPEYPGMSCETGLKGSLEWKGNFVMAKRRGMVTGSCSFKGLQEKNKGFAICTKEDTETKFKCPFGEVISGMNFIDEIMSIDTDDIWIAHSGIVV